MILKRPIVLINCALTHDYILRNTTEWLFLSLYYGEWDLTSLILSLGHNRDNRFYYFKQFVSTL